MKSINEKFTEEEYDIIKQAKDGLSWHDYILKISKNIVQQNEKKEEVING